MARGIYGAGLMGISGSINSPDGGWTFGKKGTIRRRVVPANPQTTSQQQFRAAFGFLTSEWKSLSSTQQNDWESARTGNAYYLKTDPVSGTTRPFASAKDLFIAMNLNWLIADGSLSAPAVTFTNPGVTAGTDAIGITSFVFDASAGSAVLTYTGTFNLEMAFVEATPPVSPGNLKVTAIESSFRVITSTPGASPAALGTAYTNKFGAITADTGQKIFWRITGVDILTGKARLVAQGSSIVIA